MKILSGQLKTILAKVLVAVLLVMSVGASCPSVSQAAAKPSLSKTSISIINGKQFKLDVKGKVAKATYSWSSSNKKVATVSQKGNVTAVAKGKATITCTMKTSKNTYKLTCKVTVTEADKSKEDTKQDTKEDTKDDTKQDTKDDTKQDTKDDTNTSNVDNNSTDNGPSVEVALYVMKNGTWETLKSNTIKIYQKGGTYTATCSGTKDQFTQIAALYLKDIHVESKETTTSAFSKATLKIESITFNGVKCTSTVSEVQAITSKGYFENDFLNMWGAGTEQFKEFNILGTGDYEFTAAPYKDTNTLEFTFTISNVELP